jgi:hypothetical protein
MANRRGHERDLADIDRRIDRDDHREPTRHRERRYGMHEPKPVVRTCSAEDCRCDEFDAQPFEQLTSVTREPVRHSANDFTVEAKS